MPKVRTKDFLTPYINTPQFKTKLVELLGDSPTSNATTAKVISHNNDAFEYIKTLVHPCVTTASGIISPRGGVFLIYCYLHDITKLPTCPKGLPLMFKSMEDGFVDYCASMGHRYRYRSAMVGMIQNFEELQAVVKVQKNCEIWSLVNKPQFVNLKNILIHSNIVSDSFLTNPKVHAIGGGKSIALVLRDAILSNTKITECTVCSTHNVMVGDTCGMVLCELTDTILNSTNYQQLKSNLLDFVTEYGRHPQHVETALSNPKVSTHLGQLLVDYPHVIEILTQTTKPQSSAKLYHMLTTDGIPSCKHCGNVVNISQFNSFNMAYPSTCSTSCNNKYIKHIESRLVNNTNNNRGYTTNVGKNEIELLTKYCKQNSIPLQPNTTKFVSKYIPDMVGDDIIVEVFEMHHFYPKGFTNDIQRLTTYVNTGKKVVVIIDSKSNNRTMLRQLKIHKQTFPTVEFIHRSALDGTQILTNDGFKKFIGVNVQKTTNNVVKVDTSVGSIVGTVDHNAYSGGKKVQLGDLEVGDTLDGVGNEVSTVLSTCSLPNHNKLVYDVIHVDDSKHSFLINHGDYFTDISNCVICDELAFVQPKMAEQFWSSVYPVISSSKKSKMIVISTPNGMGNLYHRLYEEGRANEDTTKGWQLFEMRWHQIPNRDEEWKEQQIAAVGEKTWLQEFECQFVGSSATLLPATQITKMSEFLKTEECKQVIRQSVEHDIIGHKVRVYHNPLPNRAYVVGCDVSDGVGGDSSVAWVFDVTDPLNVTMCAELIDEYCGTSKLPYILTWLGMNYNIAPLFVESNNMGRSVIDSLEMNYEYTNIVSYGSKFKSGIYSSTKSKMLGCTNLRNFMLAIGNKFTSYSARLLDEFTKFEKVENKAGHTYKASLGHDDTVMACIWSLFCFEPDNANAYFIPTWDTQASNGLPLHMANQFSDGDIKSLQLLYRGKLDKMQNTLVERNIASESQRVYELQAKAEHSSEIHNRHNNPFAKYDMDFAFAGGGSGFDEGFF